MNDSFVNLMFILWFLGRWSVSMNTWMSQLNCHHDAPCKTFDVTISGLPSSSNWFLNWNGLYLGIWWMLDILISCNLIHPWVFVLDRLSTPPPPAICWLGSFRSEFPHIVELSTKRSKNFIQKHLGNSFSKIWDHWRDTEYISRPNQRTRRQKYVCSRSCYLFSSVFSLSFSWQWDLRSEQVSTVDESILK